MKMAHFNTSGDKTTPPPQKKSRGPEGLWWCGIRGRTPAVRTSTTVVPDIASRLRRIQSQWMVVCPYERSLHGREWEYGIRL